MSTVTPDPTVVDIITRLKAAVALAETWTQGDTALDVVGSVGTYPSLAKLMKSTQDQIDALLTNPTLLGTGGFTPPKGTTAQREASATKGRTRYNTTLDCLEILTADGWMSLQNIIIAAYRGSVTPSIGTTRIPYDSTPPGVTEGTQLWSATVTPKVLGSIMCIDFSTMFDYSGNMNLTMALFRNNTLIGVSGVNGAGGKADSLTVSVNDTVTSLTPITYSCRVGSTAGTWYQGRAATATFGGGQTNGWKINEVLP